MRHHQTSQNLRSIVNKSCLYTLAIGVTLTVATQWAVAQSYHVLYNFRGASDGANPTAGLTPDGNGNFYGTASEGGAHGGGTVFKVTPGGALSTVYSFCTQTNCTDGNAPNGLIQATDGNLYGTTSYGLSGTVFKMTPAGGARHESEV